MVMRDEGARGRDERRLLEVFSGLTEKAGDCPPEACVCVCMYDVCLSACLDKTWIWTEWENHDQHHWARQWHRDARTGHLGQR